MHLNNDGFFRGTAFVTSIAKPAGLPPAAGPEVAFVGRSNAGKSSAINTLTGHKRLAYVSRTPGRTQLLNIFRTPAGCYLVDLPGFGYAKVPEAVRRQWVGLIEHYLMNRDALIGLVHVMDARHPLTPLDWQLLEWFAPRGLPVHILLSKADKLSRGKAAATLAEVRRALAPRGWQVSAQLFSALQRTGVAEVETVVGNWFAAAQQHTLAVVASTENGGR
ncbi:ribosome biogenesis GTP-binding protein YihA/YsxC [Hydrogenophilus thermoluteolus]|nr:ribosome biogenesis GTP-binding protein YihA/YsxC [Hydrogenophilus thermoluteolus]MBW7657396.1 ribosome biogenesis GTP-binding protein YihA/YsxC [Hydrogenophilus thermoluteolus]